MNFRQNFKQLNQIIDFDTLIKNKKVCINEKDTHQLYDFLIKDLSKSLKYDIVSVYNHLNFNELISSNNSNIIDNKIIDDTYSLQTFYKEIFSKNFDNNNIFCFRSNSLQDIENKKIFKYQFDTIIELINVETGFEGKVKGFIEVYNRNGYYKRIGYGFRGDNVLYFEFEGYN